MRKKAIPVLVVILLLLVIGASYLIMENMPSKNLMNPENYFGTDVQDGEAMIVLGKEILPDRALVQDGTYYIPFSIVQNSLNQAFYWDAEGQQVLYAGPTEMIAEPAGESGRVIRTENNIYVQTDFIKEHSDVEIQTAEAPARVIIQYQWEDQTLLSVSKNTCLRYQPEVKADILTYVYAGQDLWYMGETEHWYQAASADGFVGFIAKDEASAPENRSIERQPVEPYDYLSYPGTVNMVWHQVTFQEANDGLDEAVAEVSGINVISPTWFCLADSAGNMQSIASQSYVENAHSRGWQVWGLIDNFTNEVDTTAVLSSTSARQNLIGQLIQEAVTCGLDGINVDFEYLSEEAGPHFLEFLRELSVETHKNGIILSVDNPVPEDFTSHYDRAEQGRVVDYVVIMGYDEHYEGSDAGSVASLPWVEQGIIDTLQEVPAERTINGIPFYCRVWKANGMILYTEAIGMDGAQEVLAVHEVDAYWDSDVGQNYGKYEEDEYSCQIWVEDAQSVAAKVQLASQYGLAGVAAWKLGFESPDVWQAISDNLVS